MLSTARSGATRPVPWPACGRSAGRSTLERPAVAVFAPAPEDPVDVATEPPAETVSTVWRRVVVSIAVLRYVIPLVAIPLIPFLIVDQVPLLVLLRPQKEFLLLGGGQLRVRGEPSVALLFAAYVPLMIAAVWAFFAVGRAYGPAMRAGTGPRWLHRALPPDQLEIARSVLAAHGPAIAVLGRIAVLPPTVVAAAAGISDVSARRYLVADATGAVAGFAITVGVGYALGRAYETGGVWLTAAGVALFLGLVLLLTRWIRAEAHRHRARSSPSGLSPDTETA
jgi:membrane protein DedA with SNARE-associated domain